MKYTCIASVLTRHGLRSSRLSPSCTLVRCADVVAISHLKKKVFEIPISSGSSCQSNSQDETMVINHMSSRSSPARAYPAPSIYTQVDPSGLVFVRVL